MYNVYVNLLMCKKYIRSATALNLDFGFPQVPALIKSLLIVKKLCLVLPDHIIKDIILSTVAGV